MSGFWQSQKTLLCSNLAVGRTPSLMLAAETPHRSQWDAKQVTTLAPNTLCHTNPLLRSGENKWDILSIPLDECRVPARYKISYWIQYPQQTCSILKHGYRMMDRRPSSPCPISAFQAPHHSQGKRSSSGKCYHKVFLAFAVLSLRQPPDTFQLLSKASDMKKQQTLPKPQAHALIQSKHGRFQSGTVFWIFLWQWCRHRKTNLREMATGKHMPTNTVNLGMGRESF